MQATIVSKGIIEKACREMMHSIEACHRRLFDENHPTAIVLSGGVFTDADLFAGHFRELARHSIPNAVFQSSASATCWRGGACGIGGSANNRRSGVRQPFE